MLSQKIQDAFNKQINAELHSAYLYLSMAAYFESKDLKGMANWMTIQSGEERGHAMRFYDFINDRSGRVLLTQIEAPRPSGSRRSRPSRTPTSTRSRSPA